LLNDAMTRKVITLSLVEMKNEGRGDPPTPFAWIGMGSEGRGAQTITTDQDNGLIFQDVPEEHEARVTEWFAALAQKIVPGLEECGFALCAGNIMATNPDLLGSERHWRALFTRILTKSGDEELFEASIYFDFRCLFGKTRLVDDLHGFLTQSIEKHEFFLRHLVETTVQGSGPPVGTLRWKIYSLTGISPPPFDIKKNALVPLVAAIRVLALRDGITVTNTLERLELCLEKGRISRAMANDVRKAYDFLLRFRFKIEFALASTGEKHDHIVNIGSLLPAQARYLADSLWTVRRLQEFVYSQITGKAVHWSVR
jgi:CBS domain-containing protein